MVNKLLMEEWRILTELLNVISGSSFEMNVLTDFRFSGYINANNTKSNAKKKKRLKLYSK